ncbi:CAMK/CAMKL/MARK protein kinase [Allomyces macrogynus ATCC 38327]|uniref:CAMK/CAMKL/MARK protein kinase n=1 Tax=Allomyces macrogynus (strain ATCC 38327) TaxID=578462 RepID=A0A0L0SZN9_ALLM3|nr:CAMK/CAMKL/MARK protein kinase [Allomyces macrogynus ATCC 38327]|eukprot:KNE67824.1 CAMK/CAMKL/MARK protein kinase [Allomyces macrogynus ATCC 38327]
MASKPSSSSAKSPKKIAEETNPDFQLPGIGNYAFVKTLGEGNFAKVKLAKHKMTGQEVAIKIIDKTQLDEKKLNKLYREVRIMKTLHHPHIVRLYEVIETKSTVFLVMEYSSGGELYDYLVVHGRMKEKEARAKFRQILSAVSYCHKKRVIHRDLKAENLLLDTNLDIKIADFGFSNQFDPEGKLDTFCGSPPYAAPELFQGRRYVGPEVDVWSLGVILYVLTTGCLPFDGKNLQEMRESVCRGKYRIPFYLSDSCEKLLRKFLVRDPTKRASLDIIADDPWLNEGYTEPPICNDLSMKITEDENLIKMIELKFHIERDVIVKSLRDNVYDDISALYYLMYHERDRTGDYSRVNQVLNGVNVPTTAMSPTSGAVSPPPSMMPMAAITLPRMPASAPSSAASSPVKPSANPGVSAPTSPTGNDDAANAGKTMVAIAEDAVLPSGTTSAVSPPGSAAPLRLPPPSASTARAVSTTPCRRRFTVGSEQPDLPAPAGGHRTPDRRRRRAAVGQCGREAGHGARSRGDDGDAHVDTHDAAGRHGPSREARVGCWRHERRRRWEPARGHAAQHARPVARRFRARGAAAHGAAKFAVGARGRGRRQAAVVAVHVQFEHDEFQAARRGGGARTRRVRQAERAA